MLHANVEPASLTDPVTREPISLLGQLTKTSLGLRAPDGSVRISRLERGGYILNGPLYALNAGNYELRFRCTVGAPRSPAHPILGVEVVIAEMYLWHAFTADELVGGRGAIRFCVSPQLSSGQASLHKCNFKFFYFANAAIEITSVDLVPVEGQLTGAPAFCLLGQLRARKFAHRHTDGRVTVSRRARLGCFLSGPAFFHLPAGNFRLKVSGRAGATKFSAQPVVGVEVLSQDVQQAYCDFTAEELEQGRAALDFGVRPGPRNREGLAPFTFELHHLGNADLDIRSVSLARVETPTDAAAVKCWRLSGRLPRPSSAVLLILRDYLRLSMLFGVRPRLRLAPGCYRLGFDVRGEALKKLSGPLLDLELLAIGNWRPHRWLDWLFGRLRWRIRSTLGRLAIHRFAIDQLQNGRATCDFEAPLSWSYDGQHVWVDLRFIHRVKSRIEIDNVTIHSLTEDAAPIERSETAPAGSPRGRRAKLVVYGNCQAEILGHVVGTEWRDRFATAYQFVRVRNEEFEQSKREIEQADILLVQDIADWEDYPLREFIRDTAQIIKFPFLRLASLWPFDSQHGPADSNATALDWEQERFPYHDGLLARLRKDTPDPELRFARYASLQVDLVPNPVRLHKFEMRRLAAMDRRFDIGIGRYVVENFQHRRLFHNTSHPTGDLFARLLDQLAEMLELKPRRWPGRLLDNHFNSHQVPVHPMVARMLGVIWADENTRYRWDTEQVTWESYIRSYISHFG